MRILLDCDGVICDFVHEVLRFDCFEHTRESIKDFNIFKSWGEPERWQHFNSWIARPGIVEGMRPVPGADKFVLELKELGEVAVATSPYKGAPHWIYERILWLEKHFGFKPDEICNWSRKHGIEAEVLIDDALHNALEFPGVVFLIDQPWNQSETLPENVTRCMSFDAVLDEIKFFAHAGATRAEMVRDCAQDADDTQQCAS